MKKSHNKGNLGSKSSHLYKISCLFKINLNNIKYKITLSTKYNITAMLNTRKVVLKFIVDSLSHLQTVFSRFRVDRGVKKHWETIPREQTICNLASLSLRLK